MVLFEAVLAFLKPAFVFTLLVLDAFDLAVEFFTSGEEFVLGLELGVLDDVVGIFFSLAEKIPGSVLGTAEVEAVVATDQHQADDVADRQPCNGGQADIEQSHFDCHGGHSLRVRWLPGIRSFMYGVCTTAPATLAQMAA